MAGEIDDREQEIADLVLDLAARAGLERLADLAHFLLDLADDLGGVRPVEADGRGLAGELFGAGEGGQAGRNAGEEAGRGGLLGFPALAPALRLLGVLDLAPERLDACRREVARVAEHVRMAADQLARDALDDVAEIERAGLLGHPGMEHDLEQKVAELVLEVEKIAARDRVGDLIGFLDRVGRDGREILLEVPRAARARRAQRRHDREQALDVAGRMHSIFLRAVSEADDCGPCLIAKSSQGPLGRLKSRA